MDSLRSFIEASRAARHVQALLFLKLVADINTKLSETQQTSDLETVPAWSTFISSITNYQWARFRSIGSGVGNALDDAVQLTESKNRQALGGAFSNISFRDIARETSGEVLNDLIGFVSLADFRPWISDPTELGELFEHLTGTLLERSFPEWGEFSVPPDVASLIAELMNPAATESILDPVCGSGRLLSALATKAGHNRGLIVGQEWRTPALSLCKMNLFAHGISAHIEVGDALLSPLRDDSGNLLKADVVIGNPPFGSRLPDDLLERRPELFRGGLNPRMRSEYAFVAHMLEVAREEAGRVAVIVPQGALFREEEQATRRGFIEENLLSGVLVLPPKLFTHTKISVAVLFFDKAKKSKDVLFVDASRSFAVSGRLNCIPTEEIERVLRAFKQFKDIPGFCYVASTEEIREKNFQFSVTHYVAQERAEQEDVDFEQLGKAISATEAELAEVRSEIDRFIEALGMKAP
jgi:type I restriction enzyme M protein